jgi:formate dehydrogenase major subunit
MNSIHLTIDGKSIQAASGRTILDISRENGIEIPTLCHDPRLPPYGSCLLCVVDVQGIAKLQLSCATEAKDGMVIQTKNERVFKARKSALDLLLSNHFADCRGNCYEKCPANVDVQGYLALANAGKYMESLQLIRENNPMPLVCGRVCVRYCEKDCRRKNLDDSVGVNLIKRYVADLEHDHLPKPVVPPKNGHKIAVIGGGPCGLTAAYYLARDGFDVTIFEMHPKLGGMIRWGIPEYRLPDAVVDKEINYLLAHGINVKLNTKFGRDFTLDELTAQGFKTVFLAMGAQVAKKMGIPGEDVEGVEGGIYFLERVKKQAEVKLSGHVLVVGGGNTAIDCSRTALRCNAEKVSIVYRRTRDEMPADIVEIEDAEHEGVDFKYLTAPLSVVSEHGRVKALRCQQMTLGEPDASGRRKPVPVPGSEFDIPCSMIIGAIGQDSDLTGLSGNATGEIKTTKWKTIVADEGSYATSVRGVFAGGDIVSGPAAVIDAIGIGHRAAAVMAHYATTGETLPAPREFLSKKTTLDKLPADLFEPYQKVARAHIPQEKAEIRIESFIEVDQSIKAPDALTETGRCMSCGCTSVFTCELKKIANDYAVDQGKFHGKARKYKVDERHPFISLDANKCILCGKCVRLCGELIGSAALGFVNRGFETMVKPSMDKPLQKTTCISCGNCIDTCPTGAIDVHFPFNKPGPWVTTKHESVCNHCGVGCRIVFNRKDDDLWFVSARKAGTHQDGEICVNGRFGHTFLRSGERWRHAQVKKGRTWKNVDLNEGLNETLAGLRKIIAEHGPQAVGIFVSPRVSNEEAWLAKQLAKALQTSNLGCLENLALMGHTSLGALKESFGAVASTLPREQLEQAHVILALNSEPVTDNPVLSFHLHRAVKRGAQLLVIGEKTPHLAAPASRIITPKSGSQDVLLGAIVAKIVQLDLVPPAALARLDNGEIADGLFHLSAAQVEKMTGISDEQVTQLAKLLGAPDHNVVVLYNADSTIDQGTSDLQAIANLLLLTNKIGKPGNGLLLARNHCNAQGLIDLGISPEGMEKYTGLQGACGSVELLEMAQQGKLVGVLLIGENPKGVKGFGKLVDNAEFVAVMDMLETETIAKAQVFIPWAGLAETEGSVTSMDRRVQAFAAAFKPRNGMSGWKLLNQLLVKITDQSGLTLENARAWIAEEIPTYKSLARLGLNGTFTWNETEVGGEILYGSTFLRPDRKGRLGKSAEKTKTLHTSYAGFSSLNAYLGAHIKGRLQK